MSKDYYKCGECNELCEKKDVIIIHGSHHCMGVGVIDIYCKDCWKEEKQYFDVKGEKDE